MSWVKLDDGAYEHTKLLAAGAQAAWLWVCGLSYCNGQKRRDGFIPLAKITLLYPGVGLKQAKRLVESGLWEDTDGGYVIHGYHEYQPSESLSDVRSLVGKQGGIKSGEARRTKSEAIASSKANQVLEADNEPPSRPDPVPSRPDPTRPQPESAGRATPAAVGSSDSGTPEPDDPGRETICPLDLAAKAEIAGVPATLAAHLSVPIESIRHEIGQFVSTWTMGKLAGQRRTAWMGKLRQWVIDQHGRGALKPAGALEHDARRGPRRSGDDAPCAPSPMLAMLPGGGK